MPQTIFIGFYHSFFTHFRKQISNFVKEQERAFHCLQAFQEENRDGFLTIEWPSDDDTQLREATRRLLG